MVHLFRLRNSLHGQNKLSVFLQSFNSHGAASGYPPATLSGTVGGCEFYSAPNVSIKIYVHAYTINEYLDNLTTKLIAIVVWIGCNVCNRGK